MREANEPKEGEAGGAMEAGGTGAGFAAGADPGAGAGVERKAPFDVPDCPPGAAPTGATLDPAGAPPTEPLGAAFGVELGGEPLTPEAPVEC